MSRDKFNKIVECDKIRFASVAELRKNDSNEVKYPKKNEDIFDDIDFDYNEKLRSATIPPTPRSENLYNWRRDENNRDRQIFVNSWFMGEQEHAEMWREYAPNKEDITIQSTLESVIESLNDNHRLLFVDKVVYGDLQSMVVLPKHGLQRAIYKDKKKYEFESELRFMLDGVYEIILHNRIDDNFRFVAVNLNKMIKRLVISPNADRTDLASLEAYLKSNRISVQVRASSLNGHT
jgi:hypothetical protein